MFVSCSIPTSCKKSSRILDQLLTILKKNGENMKIQDFYKEVASAGQADEQAAFEQAYRETFRFSYGSSMPVNEAKKAIEEWLARNSSATCFGVAMKDGGLKLQSMQAAKNRRFTEWLALQGHEWGKTSRLNGKVCKCVTNLELHNK